MAEEKERSLLGNLIRGDLGESQWLISRLPVVVALAVLAVIYISIGFRTQTLHSRVGELQEQIKELRTISVASTATRMKFTRRDIIEDLLQQKGIPLSAMECQPVVIKRSEMGILEQKLEKR
ncbi:MAG: FtsL-like putative cell division protein [Rikenellaceae bacterium]